MDTINGFFAPVDTIRLDNNIFTSFGAPGGIAAGNRKIGPSASATDANDFLIYDTTSGALSYDAHGNGFGAAVHFAYIAGVAPLSAADFLIVQ
ncbi:hypothetical protein [Nitrosomonas supralitoralis]|uniref:Uncharacterized protein n=1 Tax=Nitrosomonas supralitoralis TaxID=2116706 RepID=A0A2P7NRP3_9PROT|nr:hypothetical protein [Nitrosomonas supralitoralis]PSJ16107.1 hypothetical protein C7H79_15340 [Nitrosomonas supralitoralis]